MIKQTLNSFSFLFYVLSITLRCNKVDCNSTVENGDAIMSFELFPEHKEKYLIVSRNDTITLTKQTVHTTQAKRNFCNVDTNIWGNCSCSNSHTEIYSDDDLKFSQVITYRFYEAREARASIECTIISTVNGELCGIDASMDLIHTKAALSALETNIEIDGLQFNRVYVISNHDETTIVLIRPNEGMVAFYNDSVLYNIE